MGQGVRTDQDVVNKILELAATGMKPAQIERELQLDPDFASKVPNRRTIQRWGRDYVRPGDGVEWRLGLDKLDPVGDSYVLKSLGTLIHVTEGRIRHITEDEAKWIAYLRSIATKLQPFETYLLAREYVSRTSAGDGSTAGLDAYLAFRQAFEDVGEDERWWKQRYQRALANRWVAPGPAWYDIDESRHQLKEMIDARNREEDPDGLSGRATVQEDTTDG